MTGGDDTARWAGQLRGVVLALNDRPSFADVALLRRLLATQPTHYLGGNWMDLVVEARRWLGQAEAGLPAFVRLPPDDAPVLPAEDRPRAYAD